MKETSVAKEICKIILWMFCGWILWLLVFSIFTPDEEEISDLFNAIAFCLGVVTGIVITIILKYNSVNKLKQKIKESSSNINIIIKRNKKLLEKVNKLSDKYMEHEKDIHTTISKNKSAKASSQLQILIENYPELKANESIIELMKQIKDTENNLASTKIAYNESVSKYNILIHNFPVSILRKLFRFEDIDYYKEEDDIISDEKLGI